MTGPERLRVFAAGLLLAGLPGVHLVELGYAFVSVEVLGLTALFGAAGAGVGWLLRGSRHYRIAFLAMLLCFLDVYFLTGANARAANALHPGLGIGFAVAPYVLLVTLFLAWRRVEQTLLLVVPVFAFVFFLGGLATPQAPLLAGQGAEGLPAGDPDRGIYVHLILDEQQSPLVPGSDPAGDHPGRQVLDAYAAAGFRAYGNVQSVAPNTYRSLGAVFGQTDRDDHYHEHAGGSAFSFALKENRLAAQLLDAGYRVDVVQTNFLDLCGDDPRIGCRTYTRAADMRGVAPKTRAVPQRLWLALLALHQDYRDNLGGRNIRLYRALVADGWDALRGDRASDLGFFSRAGVVLAVIDDLEDRMAGLQPGDALIAHLLLPHHPFVLDRDCALKPMRDWRMPARVWPGATDQEIFSAFWDQSECTNTRLLRALEVLDGREDVTVVIHGDHGARIFWETDRETAEDNLGTFLAVRGPGQVAGIDAAPKRLPALTTDILGAQVSNEVSEALDAPRAGR
ncbi:hypothetical protein [Mesobacterium pallidum]|uniref:hypothetical protein n=1 Tax=Mesobacterium pallidum TaxID=2872037 RepID=UPI001EE2F6D5|nr:hypothetical protein [Mesobacterium pallidum]